MGNIVLVVLLAVGILVLGVVSLVVGSLLLFGKKKPKPVTASVVSTPSYVPQLFAPSPVASYREQVKQEKADAIARIFAEETEKKFLAETIAEAKALLDARSA